MATEAGLSLSVLYHYFATKQELLFDILNEAIDDFHAVLARHAWENASSDPLERFLILVASMVEYRARSPIDSILFIREVRNLDPQYAKQIGVRRSAAQDLFEQVIGDGIDSGVFKTPYPDDAHRAIIAMLNAIPEWYRPSGKLKVENLVARYSRLGLAIVEYVGDLDTLPEN
ncbi:hypothetical protein AU186_03600 [Mycobacterium sp. GA-1999]|nr:hypothetical protein AU185_04615 [Mycobacterium sp. GA-0227b]KUH87778.1 hypothetical protein AU186_03600 [Mycobacterium sp. GA-1999]KUH88670.1 hypothetical protein AU187_06950 [Mycobacterium sp. IS-1556]